MKQRCRIAVAVILGGLSGSSQSSTLYVGTASSECPVTRASTPGLEMAGALGLALVALTNSVVQSLVSTGLSNVASSLKDPVTLTLTGTNRLNGFFTRKVDDTPATANSAAANGPATPTPPVIAVNVACLVVLVADQFEDLKSVTDPDGKAKQTPLATDFEGFNQGAIGANIFAATGAISEPKFYAEFTFEPSSDHRAIALQPQFAYFPQPIAKSQHWTMPYRELKLEVTISSIDGASMTTSLDWKDIQRGSVLGRQARAVRPKWMPLPTVDKIPQTGEFYPVSLTAQLTESDQPNGIAKAIGDALASQQASLATTASTLFDQAFIASERAKQLQSALTDAETAYGSYKAAYDAAATLAKSLATAADPDKIDLQNKFAIARAKVDALWVDVVSKYARVGQTPTRLPDLKV